MSSWLKFSSSNLQAAASEQELEAYHLAERQQRNDSERWSLHRHSCCSRWFTLSKNSTTDVKKWALLGKKLSESCQRWTFHTSVSPTRFRIWILFTRFLFFREADGDLQIWRHCPGFLQLLSTGSCWSSVLGSRAVVISLRGCVLWGVSPHLVGRVQGFRNAHLAISVLLSTAESVHFCQLMCPNFTVTCEPSHAKRRNRLLFHIPTPEDLQSPSGSWPQEKNEMQTSHNQGF